MYLWKSKVVLNTCDALFQEFKRPEKPFIRMNYSDAIKYLKDSGITKDDGSFYEFGEVSLCLFKPNK